MQSNFQISTAFKKSEMVQLDILFKHKMDNCCYKCQH